MSDVPRTDRHRHVRAALVRLFGRPCLKGYVLWSLAFALAVGIFFGLWELVPMLPKAVLHCGKEPILLAFSPDGKTLVTTDDDRDLDVGENCLYLWNVETSQLRCRIGKAGPFDRPWAFSPEGYVAFSPDGGLLAAEVGPRMGSAVWQTATGTEVARVPMSPRGDLHTERLEFSPDGQFLMIHCWEHHGGPGARFEFTVHFLEIASKQVRATFTCDRQASAAFYPVGNEFVYYHRNDAEKVVKIERWRLDDKFQAAGPLYTHEVVADQCALWPALDVFATITESTGPDDLSTLQLWDLGTGKEKARVEGVKSQRRFHELKFSSSGKFLIQNTTHWRADSCLERVGARLEESRISSDDRWFLAQSEAREAELYDTGTMQKRGTLWAPGDRVTFEMSESTGWGRRAIVFPVSLKYHFAPDSKTAIVTGITAPAKGNSVTNFLGQYIATFKPADTSVARLWDVETAQELATFHYCRTLYSPALYSSDGKTLATAHEDGTVKVWDVPPRKPIFRIIGIASVLWLTVLVGLQLWRRLIRWFFARKVKAVSEPERERRLCNRAVAHASGSDRPAGRRRWFLPHAHIKSVIGRSVRP